MLATFLHVDHLLAAHADDTSGDIVVRGHVADVLESDLSAVHLIEDRAVEVPFG